QKDDWQTFEARYNWARPRTQLMVDGPRSLVRVAVERMCEKGVLPLGGEYSKVRYIDFSYSIGDWWKGLKYPLLVGEVENDWKELHGTLRDLLQFQAKAKIGI